MDTHQRTSRVLGVAFLLQFITSFGSGIWLRTTWYVPGDIGETMLKIAENPRLLQANILVDILTALGIIFLGAILFLTLRGQNEKMALVALGFYILEAALLATSRMATYGLLRLSQEYAGAGQPQDLMTIGNLALEAMDFAGETLHILVFCLGAILFYTLLYTSRVVPRGLSLWGLITILPLLVGILLGIFDYELPFYIVLPYIPFEFVIGIWILVKGIAEIQPAPASPGGSQPAN